MWLDVQRALEEIEGGSAPPLDPTRQNDAAKPEFVAMSQMSQPSGIENQPSNAANRTSNVAFLQNVAMSQCRKPPSSQNNAGETPEFVAMSQLSKGQKTDAEPARVANVANVAAPFTSKAAAGPAQRKAHGVSFGGRPKTWTGRVVSLDAWRALSEWERHGSSGQRWNGAKRQWEQPKGAPND